MMKGKIFIISGPSGSGKTTLYRKILANNKNLVKTVSVTTRKPRDEERHGKDYFFVSPVMFSYKRRAGHFLESQKVFDNYYGTPKKAVKDLLFSGNNVLLCIDVKGAQVVWNKFPKAIKIFIKPPSLAVLERRLIHRGSEKKEIIDFRVQTAKEELKKASLYDYVIINDQLDRAYEKLENIVEKELGK